MQHTLTKRLEICIIDINIAINEVDHYTYIPGYLLILQSLDLL